MGELFMLIYGMILRWAETLKRGFGNRTSTALQQITHALSYIVEKNDTKRR